MAKFVLHTNLPHKKIRIYERNQANGCSSEYNKAMKSMEHKNSILTLYFMALDRIVRNILMVLNSFRIASS